MSFVTPFDLSSVLQAAQNHAKLKGEREDREFEKQDYYHKLEMARKKQEMMVKIKQAQAKVLQAQQPGDQTEAMSDLAALDPKTAIETQDQIGKMESAMLERAKKTRDLHLDQGLRGAQAMGDLLSGAVEQSPHGPQVNLRGLFGATSQMMKMAQQGLVDPQQAEAVGDILRRVQRAEAGGAEGEINTDKVLAEMSGAVGDIENLKKGAAFTVDLLGDPEKRKRYQAALEQVGGRAFELAGGESSDYEWQVKNNPEAVARARAELGEQSITRAKAGAPKMTLINREPGQTYDPATMGARTAFHKEELASLKMLSNLKAIDINDARKYAGAIPAAKAAGLKFIDNIINLKEGGDNEKWLEGHRMFTEQIEGVFNQYRREITGAQAAFVELENLRQSVLNKELSPSQMRGAYKRFVAELERLAWIRRRVLRKGFNVSDPEAFGNAVDLEYVLLKGKTPGNEEAQLVIKELREKDPEMSDEEIDTTLQALGL